MVQNPNLIRTIRMTPARIAALEFARHTALRQLSAACASLGKDYPDIKPWRDHIEICTEMINEANGVE
jgi:hypothetical protein